MAALDDAALGDLPPQAAVTFILHAQALWDAGRLTEWREVVAEMRRRGRGE